MAPKQVACPFSLIVSVAFTFLVYRYAGATVLSPEDANDMHGIINSMIHTSRTTNIPDVSKSIPPCFVLYIIDAAQHAFANTFHKKICIFFRRRLDLSWDHGNACGHLQNLFAASVHVDDKKPIVGSPHNSYPPILFNQCGLNAIDLRR